MLQRFAVSFKSRVSFPKGRLPLPFPDTHLCVTLTFPNNGSALREGLQRPGAALRAVGLGRGRG